MRLGDRKVTTTDLEPAKEVNYPDWRKVLPNAPKASMAINPSYLAEVLKGLPKDCHTVKLTIHETSASTTVLEVQTEEPEKRYAIVMGIKTDGVVFFAPKED